MPAYRHRQQHRFHTLRFGPRHFYRHHVQRETHPHRPRAATAARHRKQLLLALGGFAVLAMVLVLLGLSAYHSAVRAKQSLEAARTGDRERPLRQAAFRLRDRTRQAGRRTFRPLKLTQTKPHRSSTDRRGSDCLGYVPFLNDQPNGIVTLVNDVRTTAVTGSELLQRVNQLVAESNGTTVSLTALRSLQHTVADARTTVAQLDRPVGDLIGPLGTARQEFDVADRETRRRPEPRESDALLCLAVLGCGRKPNVSDCRREQRRDARPG